MELEKLRNAVQSAGLDKVAYGSGDAETQRLLCWTGCTLCSDSCSIGCSSGCLWSGQNAVA